MATNPTPPLAVSHNLFAYEQKREVIKASASLTLKKSQSGAIIMVDTDAITITLPTLADGDKNEPTMGLNFTIVAAAAAGAVLVTLQSDAASAIKGTIGVVTGTNTCTLFTSNGTANNALKCTKGTQKAGDYAQVVSDGTDSWYIVAGHGTWTN